MTSRWTGWKRQQEFGSKKVKTEESLWGRSVKKLALHSGAGCLRGVNAAKRVEGNENSKEKKISELCALEYG